MKKKLFLVLVAVLLTTASAFANDYVATIDCGNGEIHHAYIGGCEDKYEALIIASELAEDICE
ncbi:MAG: hypothetical protein H6Q18_1115 [Bacteroidetes bacterium]|nr:hypothetical protein [Bacteroidota bacterium]